MSNARHARPRRSASMHPAVIGTTAAVVGVGGVALIHPDADPLAPASVAVAADQGAPAARTADSAAASRSSTREVLKAPAKGTGKHRKGDPTPIPTPQAPAAKPAADAGLVQIAAAQTPPPANPAPPVEPGPPALVVVAPVEDGPPKLRKACGYRASAQRTPDLNRTQRRNARTIVEVAQKRDLPIRAAVIALATAQQESEMLNINYGDRDSLGLFQQRPSMGWGSPRQVRDPQYAAAKFYSALVEVDGWKRLPLTVAAQRVQRSAFPDAYARWELLAATTVDDLLDGVPDDELNCRG